MGGGYRFPRDFGPHFQWTRALKECEEIQRERGEPEMRQLADAYERAYRAQLLPVIDRINQRGLIREHYLRNDGRTLCGLPIDTSQEAIGNPPCRNCWRLMVMRFNPRPSGFDSFVSHVPIQLPHAGTALA